MVKILYHANCADGFCCAWLMHQVYKDAEFMPVSYGQKPPIITDQDAVFILDFCYPLDIMLEIARCSRYTFLVDHHKSNAEIAHALKTNIKVIVIFDPEHSAGHLVHKHLGFVRESLVEYTEDYDLYKFDLPNSKAINAAIQSYQYDFDDWDYLARQTANDLIISGEAILRFQAKVVKEHVENAKLISFLSHEAVPIVNATIFKDQIGEELAKNFPLSITYRDRKDGQRVFSLRSSSEGVDVSEVAKLFPGGGGHKHAAGFQIPITNMAIV